MDPGLRRDDRQVGLFSKAIEIQSSGIPGASDVLD